MGKMSIVVFEEDVFVDEDGIGFARDGGVFRMYRNGEQKLLGQQLRDELDDAGIRYRVEAECDDDDKSRLSKRWRQVMDDEGCYCLDGMIPRKEWDEALEVSR